MFLEALTTLNEQLMSKFKKYLTFFVLPIFLGFLLKLYFSHFQSLKRN